MDIYVLNSSFEKVGIIDNYSSIIWTTRYFEPGDFELYAAADSYTLDLIRNNDYLVRDKDIVNDEYHNVMIIDKPNIKINTDIENGDFITITGKCLKSIVGRRIVENQTVLNGKLEICLFRLLNENLIDPVNTKRKIPNFTFDNSTDFGINLTKQTTGDNLSELITEICTNFGIGWDIKIKDNKFVFYLYQGTDRSSGQSTNPHVIFSYEFDNLLTTDYSEDYTAYANVAIVAGEGEGSARRKLETGNSLVTGLNRFEIFVDARDLSSNDGEIDDAEYENMLDEKGKESLAEVQSAITFEGEVDATRNYVLNQDFFIGDLVQVINNYGISRSTRIIEIIESDDESGQTIIPTFLDF